MLFEIRCGEFAEIFLCGLVVCFGRFCFVVEIAKEFHFSFGEYLCSPFFIAAAECDAFVFGAAVVFRLLPVPCVLLLRHESQVCRPIVQAVMIDMVEQLALSRMHNITMH